MQSMTAITRYTDYTGTVSIDNDDRKNAYAQLAKDNGIDLSNQYLVGIKFEKIEMIQQVVFITSNVGSNFQEIQDYLSDNDSLPCKESYVDMSINDFFKYTKRFSFIYSTNKELIGQNINIIEEVSV